MQSTAGSQTSTRARLMRPLAIAAVSAAAVMGPQAAGVAAAAPELAAAPTPACADVEVVFARGTFEAPGVGVTGQAFVDALTSQLPGKTIDVYGVNYPASLDFQAAAQGVSDASAKIEAVAASCPDTKIVLGGYSQGAAVAAYTTAAAVPAGFTLPAGISGPMPPGVADNVVAVVLYGTPDPWFLGLVDHSAPPIVIGPGYAAKTLQLCNTGDPVCFPGGFDRAAHSAYKDNGMAVQAATYAAKAVAPSTV
jgi:cutinase